MYTKTEKAEFGFGTINDDYLLAGVSEFEHANGTLVKKVSFVTYVNPETTAKLYEYKGALYEFKELNLEYLKDYYSVG